MKTLIKIVLLLAAGIMWVSCQDEDGVSPDKQLNKYRAKTISGHNELWGDFSISLQYSNNLLDVGVVTNTQNDTIANITKGVVTMKVPELTQEEIEELQPGTEIPMTSRIIYQISRTTQTETVTYYKRDGLQFTFNYEENYIYEYEDTLSVNRKVLKWRCVGDEESDQPIGRMIYQYDGDKIQHGEYAVYDNTWLLVSNWNYQYDGNRLKGINVTSGESKVVLKKDFTYLDNEKVKVVTQTESGTTEVIYSINADGYVTRIDQGNGNYMEIKYETGHGNFSDFVPEAIRLQGDPYIK